MPTLMRRPDDDPVLPRHATVSVDVAFGGTARRELPNGETGLDAAAGGALGAAAGTNWGFQVDHGLAPGGFSDPELTCSPHL